MTVTTIYRIAEECLKILSGGNIQLASNVSINELKIAAGQVINGLLKTDYLKINTKTRETIPNGTVIGTYENIAVSQKGFKSTAILPIKPIQLPRNMGVWAIWQTDIPEREFIPIQMGQYGLLQSQPLINDLLGQVGYETYGNKVLFTKDLTQGGQYTVTVDMRLVIMDISQYGDFDPLPILPEHEFIVKQEVIKLFSGEQVADKVVDSSTKQLQGIPLKDQKQS